MKEYTADSRLRELIDRDNRMLLVLSWFSIPFGFGDKTIREVCRHCNVDCDTFLAVVNLISSDHIKEQYISLNSLTYFLKKSHSYLLNYSLPLIRRKLVEALYSSGVNDIAVLILNYFDNYAVEVKSHMDFENDHLFSYINSLFEGKTDEYFNLKKYENHHSDMSEKLNELKDIIVCHYTDGENDLLNAALYDITNLQNDLILHCKVETRLLMPAVHDLIENVRRKCCKKKKRLEEGDDKSPLQSVLSDREKQIVACVAKGLSNKEIAMELCLSVNTVTTHRRNIATKLQIHSQAGLTIYAIMHKLIELQEVRME